MVVLVEFTMGDMRCAVGWLVVMPSRELDLRGTGLQEEVGNCENRAHSFHLVFFRFVMFWGGSGQMT